MSNLNYCLGMLDLVDETNIDEVKIKIMKRKKDFSIQELTNIVTVLTDKYYNLAIYKPIKNLFEEFNVPLVFFIKNDYILHAYIRSLAVNKEYKKIIEVSTSIDIKNIKKFQSKIVGNISRALTFEGDLDSALQLIETQDEFKCHMMKLEILRRKGLKNEMIKQCIILREKYNSAEEQIHLDFWLAEIYFEDKNSKQLKDLISVIRINIYKTDKYYLATRSLLMYNFLVFLNEEVRAYSFLKHLITHKSLSRFEVDNKIEAFKILIEKYNHKKEKLIEETSKYEAIENFFIIKNTLI